MLILLIEVDETNNVQIRTGFQPVLFYVGKHLFVGFIYALGAAFMLAAKGPCAWKVKGVFRGVCGQKRKAYNTAVNVIFLHKILIGDG